MGCGSSSSTGEQIAADANGAQQPSKLQQPPGEPRPDPDSELALLEEPEAAPLTQTDAETTNAEARHRASSPEPEPEPPAQLELAFDAVKDLWFSAAELGRGRALVALQDTVTAHRSTFAQLFLKFTGSQESMSKAQWLECTATMKVDLDEDVLGNHFDEVVGYPDEEDEDAGTAPATLGQFAAMLCRVANDLSLQSSGMADGPDLAGQLMQFLRAHAPRLDLTFASKAEVVLAHGEEFFRPPVGWGRGQPVRCFMEVAIKSVSGQRGGRVTFELNTEVTPITAYNFYALCTGERGVGVVDRKPLNFRGSVFHRIIPDMMCQGGDIVCGNGLGGESVYGGEFADENFRLTHDSEGVLSSANMGQNTNQSQFFITLAPYPSLNGENVAFGKVVEGMDVVKMVGAVPTNEEDAPSDGTTVTVIECGAVDC